MRTTTVAFVMAVVAQFGSAAFAQSDCFPINAQTNQAEYRGRVNMSSLDQGQVFNKILIWGVTKALSDREILKDREAGILKFQVQVNYKYKDTFKPAYYSISLLANDGHFEYTVNAFNMNNRPMEVYLTDKSNDQVYRAAFADICEKVKSTINELKYLKPEE